MYTSLVVNIHPGLEHLGNWFYCVLFVFSPAPGELGVTWLDDNSSVSSGGMGPLPTSQPILPPIGQTHTALTPIGEASREQTQAYISTKGKDGKLLVMAITDIVVILQV